MPIDPITQVNRISSLANLSRVDNTGGVTPGQEDFGQMLSHALEGLSQMESDANQAATSLAAGEDLEIHQVMLAMQEADIGFQLALQVRNKLVEAYQEVMRMQI